VRRRAAALALALAAVTALSGCVIEAERRAVFELSDQLTDAEFYTLPASIPAGEPGDLIRAKSIQSSPAGTRAWRVIYHSTDLAGNDIPVSGVVIVPDLPAPKDGRTVVSWAHPTTGSAQKCGPSLATSPFSLIEGMANLLAQGYAVVATDYQGMTIAGPSSYLLGVTEGNNVLDAVRAGRNLPDISLSSHVLLWGHSQGGQAALFAAQQARAYAPELDVRAVAVAAPAASLTALLSDDIIDVSGVTIASLAIPAMVAAYRDTYDETELWSILTPAGQAAAPKVQELCLLTDTAKIHEITGPLVGGFVASDPSTTEPWKTILTENSAGGQPLGMPVYIAQGLDDKLVIPEATAGYVKELCAAGESVQFDEFAGITHALVALTATPAVLSFFAAVEKGDAPSNCIG
jgi:pimeloyl-ACP methyl ester carboxylesterase